MAVSVDQLDLAKVLISHWDLGSPPSKIVLAEGISSGRTMHKYHVINHCDKSRNEAISALRFILSHQERLYR